MSSLLSILTFGLVTGAGYGSRDTNLVGQHTGRMSPSSTAQLNPYSQLFCLDASSNSVLVPILLNNSNPTSLHYTITPLGYTESSGGKIESVTLSARDLKAIENSRLERLRVTKTTKQEYYDDSIDDYDDEYPNNDSRDAPSSLPRLQKTQSIVHIRLSKPGTIHLKDVSDSSGVDARISYPSEITIAPCPHAQFVDGDALTRGDNIKCAAPSLNTLGEDKDVPLTLSIFGVPPLSLKWFKEINALLKRSACRLPSPSKLLVSILMCLRLFRTPSGTWSTYLGRLQSTETYLPDPIQKLVVLSEFFIALPWLSRAVDPKSQLPFASALMFH
jgi:nucleoporin POM152